MPAEETVRVVLTGVALFHTAFAAEEIAPVVVTAPVTVAFNFVASLWPTVVGPGAEPLDALPANNILPEPVKAGDKLTFTVESPAHGI